MEGGGEGGGGNAEEWMVLGGKGDGSWVRTISSQLQIATTLHQFSHSV